MVYKFYEYAGLGWRGFVNRAYAPKGGTEHSSAPAVHRRASLQPYILRMFAPFGDEVQGDASAVGCTHGYSNLPPSGNWSLLFFISLIV
jgi:hypothetical protein